MRETVLGGRESLNYPMQQYTVGNVIVAVAQVGLLHAGAEAVMLAANNNLRASWDPNHWSWSQAAENAAGPAYLNECPRIVAAAGRDGLEQVDAVVTGGGYLTNGRTNQWVIQAVTIHYTNGHTTPATRQIVYKAVRVGLEKAEAFHAGRIATYLMVQRPGYGVQLPEPLALSLCEALLDHAAVATSVQRLMICETDPQLHGRALEALDQAFRSRV